MDGRIREAVVVEEAHLLVEQAVDDVRPGVLPLDQADQLAVQRGTQVHGPVVTVQGHLERQWQPVRPVEEASRTVRQRPAGRPAEEVSPVTDGQMQLLLALAHLFVQDTDEEEPLAGSQCCSGPVWTPAVRLLQSLEALEALVSYSEETEESVRVTEKQRHSAVGPLPSTQRQSIGFSLQKGHSSAVEILPFHIFFVACSLVHGA